MNAISKLLGKNASFLVTQSYNIFDEYGPDILFAIDYFHAIEI